MREITWKRTSALNGERVAIDAFIGDRRVAQITSTIDGTGARAWDVWIAGAGRVGGIHRTVPLAKTAVRRLVKEQVSPLPV